MANIGDCSVVDRLFFYLSERAPIFSFILENDDNIVTLHKIWKPCHRITMELLSFD